MTFTTEQGSLIRELAAKPVVHLWHEIAQAGSIVAITGGPSVGKTTLLFLILAARMNRGAPIELLGREVAPIPEGQFVVLVEGDHGLASTARKLVRSLSILDVDDTALDRVIVISRKSVRLGSGEWSDIERLVCAGLVSDIALDRLARVAPSHFNAWQEQDAIFDAIAETIDLAPDEGTKPVVWAVAQTSGEDADPLKVCEADTVLQLRAERRDGRVLSTKVTFEKLSEEPDNYPLPVEYTCTAHGIVTIGPSKPQNARPLEQRILARLALGPQTQSALRTALARSGHTINRAVTNLLGANAIVTTQMKTRSGIHKAYDLPRAGAQHPGHAPPSGRAADSNETP